MLNISDSKYPYLNGNTVVVSLGLTRDMIEKTTHIKTGEKRFCYRCEKQINTYVVKPYGRYVWCLSCW